MSARRAGSSSDYGFEWLKPFATTARRKGENVEAAALAVPHWRASRQWHPSKAGRGIRAAQEITAMISSHFIALPGWRAWTHLTLPLPSGEWPMTTVPRLVVFMSAQKSPRDLVRARC